MASQKPPTLPWFRLASVSRPTTTSAPLQAQALPVARTRPSIIRPTLTQSSSNTPTQPAQPPLAPPTQAATPLSVAASALVPASKSPPPQAATAPPAKNSPLSPHKNGGNPRTGSVGEKYRSDSGRSNEEGRGKSKDKSYMAMNNSSRPMSAFMNNNVQGVNNSILYNCSYCHHDPGVHFSLYQKANGHANGIKPSNIEDRASGIW